MGYSYTQTHVNSLQYYYDDDDDEVEDNYFCCSKHFAQWWTALISLAVLMFVTYLLYPHYLPPSHSN